MSRRASHLGQLTIRGFDPAVETHIRELARREHLSLNQAVMKLLRHATGADESPGRRVVGDTLDHLAGTWTTADRDDFGRTTGSLERIDHDLWRQPPKSRRKRR